MRRKLEVRPGGNGPNIRAPALPRGHAKCPQAVVGVPTESRTGQVRQRNAMPHAHRDTHARRRYFVSEAWAYDLTQLPTYYLVLTTNTLPTTYYDLAPTAYYYLVPTLLPLPVTVAFFSSGMQAPLPINVHAID